ncbi:MAG: YceK/YidQ family lipoprotein [Puniceicoccales bacterium]|jgi:uncharacterized protein YceK|nr:YceK/YidQ family lipoprotein [Puniceicoccales bacterium]
MMRVSREDVKHDNGTPMPVYIGTTANAQGLQYWYSTEHKAWGIRAGWILFLCLDLPLDIVTDTLCFPYDSYAHQRDKQDMAFWKEVLANNNSALPLSIYKTHLSRCGHWQIAQIQRADARGYIETDKYTKDEKGWTVRVRQSVPKGTLSPEMIAVLYQIGANIDFTHPNIPESMIDDMLAVNDLNVLSCVVIPPRVWANLFEKNRAYMDSKMMDTGDKLPTEMLLKIKHRLLAYQEQLSNDDKPFDEIIPYFNWFKKDIRPPAVRGREFYWNNDQLPYRNVCLQTTRALLRQCESLEDTRSSGHPTTKVKDDPQ